MPWWLTSIFPALLVTFAAGLLVGVLAQSGRLRSRQEEYDQRRLAGEAESDRLRLRISSLQVRDEQATALEAEVSDLRAKSERIDALQAMLQEAETRAHLVPVLERELAEARGEGPGPGHAPGSELSVDEWSAEVERLLAEPDETLAEGSAPVPEDGVGDDETGDQDPPDDDQP